MDKHLIKKIIALLLVVTDLVLLAMGSHLIWGMRDQGYASSSPSVGAVALRHFVGFFPIGPALFMFSVVLLTAWFIYPWKPRISETELPVHSQPEAGIWPPPPNKPDVAKSRRVIHHWSWPDED